MIRSLVQFTEEGARGVAALDADGIARRIPAVRGTLELAQKAMAARQSLAGLAGELAGDTLDLATVRLLSPIDHDDPAHLLVSGTGLTHLGSAEGRDKMHRAASSGEQAANRRRALPECSRNVSTRATDRSLFRRASRSSCPTSPKMAARSRKSRAST